MTMLSMFRGDDQSFLLTIVDGDGEPFDLEDADLEFNAVWRFGDPVITKTLLDGITVTNAEAGLATIAIAADDTEELELGRLRWDLQVTKDEVVRTVATGTLDLRGDVTRASP